MTNWNDLPVEMMWECIKHLDFKDRMNMRATARLEKELIESRKPRVEMVMVEAYLQDEFTVYVESPHEPSACFPKKFEGSIEKVTSFVSCLINFTRIKSFHIFAEYPTRPFSNDLMNFLETITAAGNFKFPILNINHFGDNDFQSLLEMSTPGTELLHFFRPPKRGFKRVFRDPTTLPLLLGASIIELSSSSLANVIVEAWLTNDQTIGKKVVIWLGSYNDEDKWIYDRDDLPNEDRIVSEFKSRFEERVVEQKEKSVRIRMDDSSKHILMRILEEDDDGYVLVTANWQVIPADFVEEQYEKKSGWVYVGC